MKPGVHQPLALLCGLALLAACAAPSPQPNRKPSTIGDLYKQPPAQAHSRASTAVETNPADANVNYQALLEQEDLDPAVRGEVSKRLAANPADPENEDYETTIRLYRELLQENPNLPNNDKLLYQLARAYELNGQAQQAVNVLARLTREYPSSALKQEAHFRRAEIEFVQGDYAAAEADYRQVLAGPAASPFYRPARYKLGWTLYKRSEYRGSLDQFTLLLNEMLPAAAFDTYGRIDPGALPRAEQELVNDSLRAVNLNFTNLGSDLTVGAYIDRQRLPRYDLPFHEGLAKSYLEDERYNDAAQVYEAFARRNPDHPLAIEFEQAAIAALTAGGFPTLVLQRKQAFVERYGLAREPWRGSDPLTVPQVRQRLLSNLDELTRHYHAQAQETKKPADYATAARWYRNYLKIFPQAPRAPELHFLLGELLFESQDYADAVAQYESAAYGEPAYEQAAEAGYAALLAYRRQIEGAAGERRDALRRKAAQSAERFAANFPTDKRAAAVLTRAAEDLYAAGDGAAAATLAERALQYSEADPAQRRSALILSAHNAFAAEDYAAAQENYQAALALPTDDGEQALVLKRRLAAAVYRQGEAKLKSGEYEAAVAHFKQVEKITAGAQDEQLREIHASATFDGATALIKSEQWERTAAWLEDFRAEFPAHPLQAQVERKLATAYLKAGASSKAAAQLRQLGNQDTDPQVQREAAWRAAELYQEAGETQAAILAWNDYLERFPQPVEQAQEARWKLAQLYESQGNTRRSWQWLRQLVETEAEYRSGERGRYLAAKASLELAEPARRDYLDTALNNPIERSLPKKQEKLEAALAAYAKAADYGVAEVTTAATYRIGELYQDFSQTLLNSQPPAGLEGESLAQYELLLEEQAFPFEEQAIEIHAANLARIEDGIYDQWTRRSIEQLARLQPARYARTERSSDAVRQLQ